MKEYEIWVGYYHLGQGYDPSTEPQLCGKETASDFPLACLKHELKRILKSIEESEIKGERVDNQSRHWWYNPGTNSNDWLGQYFESYNEALKTFKQ